MQNAALSSTSDDSMRFLNSSHIHCQLSFASKTQLSTGAKSEMRLKASWTRLSAGVPSARRKRNTGYLAPETVLLAC